MFSKNKQRRFVFVMILTDPLLSKLHFGYVRGNKAHFNWTTTDRQSGHRKEKTTRSILDIASAKLLTYRLIILSSRDFKHTVFLKADKLIVVVTVFLHPIVKCIRILRSTKYPLVVGFKHSKFS